MKSKLVYMSFYLFGTMIFELLGESGVHVSLKVHLFGSVEIIKVLKTRPSLLDPDTSVQTKHLRSDFKPFEFKNGNSTK